MKTISVVCSMFCMLLFQYSYAQEDLMKLLQDSTKETEKEYTIATFKTTRLINSHTIETTGKRTLDFRISHRFGDVNGGTYQAFGIDGPANIRIGVEYSYDGRLMFGIGRSSYEKLADGFMKYRLLRQTTNNIMPLSITLFASINYTSMKDPNKSINGFDKYEHTLNRLSYAYQIIIGRKFSNNFSFQCTPTLVHYNIVDKISDQNDIYAIGFSSRYKLSKSFAITGEYNLRINKYTRTFSSYYNAAGIGFDLETGGHVFQIHFTNAFGINEVQYIPYTGSSWKDFGIRLGFNILRVFTI